MRLGCDWLTGSAGKDSHRPSLEGWWHPVKTGMFDGVGHFNWCLLSNMEWILVGCPTTLSSSKGMCETQSNRRAANTKLTVLMLIQQNINSELQGNQRAAAAAAAAH